MHILILHQVGKRAFEVQRRLKFENISSECVNVNLLAWDKLLEKLNKAHAIILYVRSPINKAPLDLLPNLRRKSNLPIICLDEKDNPETEIFVKRHGNTSYFPAPFSFADIGIKLKFLVYRKTRANGNYSLRTGDLIIDLLSHQLKRNHELISLRSREFALLEFLMMNRGRTLTRNMILEQVWDRNTSILSNTIDVHLSRLRIKLETDGKKYFHTVHAIGYKFEPKTV